MDNEIKEVLSFIKSQGVEYADIRVVDSCKEEIYSENMEIEDLVDSRSKGVGIRVLAEGYLGFYATQDTGNLKVSALKAIEIAFNSKQAGAYKISMAEKPPIIDHYETPIRINPFNVSKKEKIKAMMDAQRIISNSDGISRTSCTFKFRKDHKTYYDTEGSHIVQNIYQSGGGIAAYAASNNDMQIRSYPDSFGGTYRSAGYEFIHELKLEDNAARIAREAILLVNAEVCPTGIYDVIIDGSQMAIQLHESIGHPVELDRILGAEAAFAGKSFVSLEQLNGSFVYGSKHITVNSDGNQMNGLGTYGYDDDGVRTQSFTIIDKGILKNSINSRESAGKIGRFSNGCSFADGWMNIPIVRMTNINLEPGQHELLELARGIDYGLYLCTNKSWSIDDKRLNFQFGCEIAYEIKDGCFTGKVFKNPTYSGITTEFWKKCDGVCNEDYWFSYGIPNCIKGQPIQTSRVGHGTAPARFRGIKVGV